MMLSARGKSAESVSKKCEDRTFLEILPSWRLVRIDWANTEGCLDGMGQKSSQICIW